MPNSLPSAFVVNGVSSEIIKIYDVLRKFFTVTFTALFTKASSCQKSMLLSQRATNAPLRNLRTDILFSGATISNFFDIFDTCQIHC